MLPPNWLDVLSHDQGGTGPQCLTCLSSQIASLFAYSGAETRMTQHNVVDQPRAKLALVPPTLVPQPFLRFVVGQVAPVS